MLLTIDADGALVAEIERRLRVSEPVIKFITVRMDEEEKRVAKIKAIRATRKKLSAQPGSGARRCGCPGREPRRACGGSRSRCCSSRARKLRVNQRAP